VVTGDLMHHALQCREPDWSTVFDWDRDEAARSRRRFLGEVAGTGTVVMPVTSRTRPPGGSRRMESNSATYSRAEVRTRIVAGLPVRPGSNDPVSDLAAAAKKSATPGVPVWRTRHPGQSDRRSSAGLRHHLRYLLNHSSVRVQASLAAPSS
jgi:hypothetical protein